MHRSLMVLDRDVVSGDAEEGCTPVRTGSLVSGTRLVVPGVVLQASQGGSVLHFPWGGRTE